VRTTRIYHPEPLADDAEVELSESAVRHLGRVLRLSAGAGFTLFDGSGREWPATLTAGGYRARTGRGTVVDRESPLELTLVQGISRGERMDWTIQKAVELGVVAIVPVFTERSSVKLTTERRARRVEHWHGVIIAACEQSGRTRLPGLAEPCELADWLRTSKGPACVLDPEAETRLAELEPPRPTLALLAGPEGGLTPEEIAAAHAAECTPVRLGPRVLRTETAGIAALAALQALHGDLG
jgi:16S rRNA (uracil1498-N3)-methyltransferase